MGRIERQGLGEIYDEVFEQGEKLGDKKNCGPIAIAIVTGRPYKEVFEKLKEHGRKKHRGCSDEVIEKTLNDFGFEFKSFSCMRMHREIISKYPGVHKKLINVTTHHPRRFPLPFKNMGVSLWFSREHVSAFMDGKIHDHAVNNSRRVNYIWLIQRKENEQKSGNNRSWAGGTSLRLSNGQEWLPSYCA